MMFPELQRPRITEIHIRIDCNGCVHKIKKALNAIHGIYDFYIDIPQQKLTIIGWADPERIIKAIKKVRKIATICSHTEAPDPNCQPPQPPPPDGEAPPPQPDSGIPPPQNSEGPPPPSQEPPNNNQQPPPQPPENPPEQNCPPETNTQPQGPDAQQQTQTPCEPRHEEVRVLYHHPPDHGYRYVTHSYNRYSPSPNITEYQYVQSPPQYATYSRMHHHYDVDQYQSGSTNNGNVTSMFSDENPNACTIV